MTSFALPTFYKTVLTRIISIVRVPSLYPNKDNSINRDDDAKRSPLSAKHVAGFAFMAIGQRRLMTITFPPLVGELEEVMIFWAVVFF